MKETNKDNLKKSLDNLPEYEPQGNIWDNIESKLDSVAGSKVLSEGIANLPEHEPPTQVWDNINQTLAADSRGKIGGLRVRRLQRLAAAAVALLLVGSFYFITNQALDNGETIEYAEEIVEDVLLERNWEGDDEDAFAQILAMCEMQSYACTQPVFQSLKSELDELTAARDMLREAIGEFGTDYELLGELKEIEMLRTDIIKQLAAEVA
jgi:hypothetical protein